MSNTFESSGTPPIGGGQGSSGDDATGSVNPSPTAVLRVSSETFAYARDESRPSEDASVVKESAGAVIAAVADGLGSTKQGGEAATRVMETLARSFPARPHAWNAGKAVQEILRHLNHRLLQEGLARHETPELATTVAAVAIEGNLLHALNLGDSRIYLWRTGRLQQLSTDHREPHPDREHVLTRAMGIDEDYSPTISTHTVEAGDAILLCSDGVTDVLTDAALTELLSNGSGASVIAGTARRQSTEATRDDITTVLIKVIETAPAPQSVGRSVNVPRGLNVGDEVDEFTLQKSFGHGERIWLADLSGASYVLKFAPREAAENEASLTAFEKEIWHATRLRARFFPTAFVPENASAVYYALEYIKAPTLKDHLAANGPLKTAEAVELGRFILCAEQFLLRHDFVHGDLKPENILVLHEGGELRFKLIDLGSVAEVFSVQGRAGTPSYLAPERFKGAPMTERAEIFALGITLYEALSGKLPYGEVEPFQKPSFGKTKPLSALNPLVPSWLESVIARAIAEDPERRHETYSEVLFELENPAKVQPFHRAGASLVERNPLMFYKVGFLILLVVVMVLTGLLISTVR